MVHHQPASSANSSFDRRPVRQLWVQQRLQLLHASDPPVEPSNDTSSARARATPTENSRDGENFWPLSLPFFATVGMTDSAIVTGNSGGLPGNRLARGEAATVLSDAAGLRRPNGD